MYLKYCRFCSTWAHVTLAPPDPILGLNDKFMKEKNPKKINVGVGAYRDNDGKPYVLSAVQKAECIMAQKNYNKEYIPIDGIAEFRNLSIQLALGADNPALKAGNNATVQSLSGTGALNLGTVFLREFGLSKLIFVPVPTWGNHNTLFEANGLKVKTYTYYDPKSRGLNFDGFMKDIQNMPEKSTILLHACAHNPTGVDPKPEQWAEISQVIKCKNIFPFFDMAYQGFATGDTEYDAYAVRLFLQDCHDIALAQSFSKNMGLYGERVGAFTVLTKDPDNTERIISQLKLIIRATYSNPPSHGARIVQEILSNAELKREWLCEVKGMADRISSMRKMLKEKLVKIGSSHNWDHITNQIGMFCYTGLKPEQVEILIKKYGIYLTKNGRISIAGINTNNVEYLATAMHEVTK